MFEAVDDLIYRDARGRAGDNEDFAYTEDETTLSTIVDEAQSHITKMLEATP
jgi:hypothetical protein